MKTMVEIERNSEPRPVGPYDWAVKVDGKTIITGNSETYLGAVAQAAFVPVDISTGEVASYKMVGWGLSEAECLAKLHSEYWQIAMKKAAKRKAA